MLKVGVLLTFCVFCSIIVVESSCPIIPQSIDIPINLNANFSPNTCIVLANYSTPDCELAPPDRIVPDEAPDPCPGSHAPTHQFINGSQVAYHTIEDALAFCLYDPLLIEFIGTLYRTSDPIVYYNDTRDLIIRGISQVVEFPATELVELVPVNFTYFNETTNTTETIEIYVNETTIVPGYNITVQPILVGVMNLQVLWTNISITLENFINEGCGTEDAFFYSRTCNETCRSDGTGFCSGEWFLASDNVTTLGVCQGTGGFFNNTNRLLIQNNSDPYPNEESAWFNYQNQVTIEAWINPEVQAQPKYTLILGNYRPSNGLSGSSGYGFVYDNDGEYSSYIRFIVVTGHNSRNVHCVTAIPANRWTHLAGRFLNGKIYLYQNGVEVCTDQGQLQSVYYVENRGVGMQIGGGVQNFDENDNPDTFNHFMGLIDEVRVWNYTRSSDEIYFNFDMSYPIPNTEYGLAVYMRFDWGAYGTDFLTNYGDVDLPVWSFNRNLPGPNPAAVYDCFCENFGDTCVPSNDPVLVPPSALTSFSPFLPSDSYVFIHGKMISPNGIYGQIWLPGLTLTTGPAYNITQYFIPGEYIMWPVWEPVIMGNITVYVMSLSETSLQFIPGVIPSLLPPLGFNQWSLLDYFVPGWFANSNLPPYTANNFFPGIFMPQPATVPTPEACDPQDMVFVPGLWTTNGTFVPFTMPDPNYVIPITLLGGFCFNVTLDTDNCTIPSLPIIDVPPPTPVIESLLGCIIDPFAPVPVYLNQSAHHPCEILRHLRSTFPPGTSTLEPEEILGCGNIGPNDPEPVYLNRSARDPCFILRDIRAAIPEPSITCSSNEIYVPPYYIPCATNQDLTIQSVTFRNYFGENTICQWSCEKDTTFTLQNSYFINTPGYAVWISGMENYYINDNSFCPCGGLTEGCVYVNGNHVSRGDYFIYNNRHCAVTDLLPHICHYDLTPFVKCDAGALMCVDVAATLEMGCDTQDLDIGVTVFDNECAVYVPCTCGAVNVSIVLPDGSTTIVLANTDSIEVIVTMFTPDLVVFLNESDSLFLPCQTSETLQAFNYSCPENVTMEVTIGNITMNVTTTVMTTCTTMIPVSNGTGIACPCSADFNASLVTNLTGSAAASALGLYSNCEWAIPDGLPGEECVDGVVWCPYLGGTLGSGEPPPPPPGVCNDGIAVIPCSDCVGGNVQYEGVNQSCPLECFFPTNDTISYFNLPCACTDFFLVVPCTRTECINATAICNVTINALCSYDGLLTFDGVDYPCYVDENETNCFGISYAPSHPAFPPDGEMIVPCDNTYQVPSPGPCSCLGNSILNDNITLANDPVVCNYTADPNCTATAPSNPDTGDPALQYQCSPSGVLLCRCDGFQAINIPSLPNYTISPSCSAYIIDHVSPEAAWFQRNNVAQQLPIGWRYERFSYDLIKRFALQYLHYYSAWAVMYESGRWGMSPYITGTVADWADGEPDQYNLRTCSTAFPPVDIHDDCQQYRPGPWNPDAPACVVDSRYSFSQTADFDITRFNRINRAINLCPYPAVLVNRAVNAYEEEMKIYRSNVYLGTLDTAVNVASGHQIRAEGVTIRGFRFVHPTTNVFPIFQPTIVDPDNNFDTAFNDADAPGEQPGSFYLLNNYFNGHSVDKSGVLVGAFANNTVFNYNTVDSFRTKIIFIYSPTVTFLQNTFIRCRGRVVRVEFVDSYKYNENLHINCLGIDGARHVESVMFWANGDLGGVPIKQSIGNLIFTNLTADEYIEAFDIETTLENLVYTNMGCNPTLRPNTDCSFSGNRHLVSDIDDRNDYSTLCYRLIGGAITSEFVRDNTCEHAQIGMDFSYTPFMGYLNRAEIFQNNPLIRTQDSRNDKRNAADFSFRAPGSLSTIGCYFPNCYYPDQPFPIMQVNPRCDLNLGVHYGLDCINNLTAAQRYAIPLALLNVTSERARLRREIFDFENDVYAVGYSDAPCCAPPVFYGSRHTFATGTTVYDNIELRFEFVEDALKIDRDDENLSEKLVFTKRSGYAQDIRFYNCNFDGQYASAYGSIYITQFYLDPETGVFVMDNCHIYNWFHLPDNTRLGTMETANGDEKVVVLLDQDVVYKANRVPTIAGVTVFFQPWKKNDQSSYSRHTVRNPDKILNSMAIITNNLVETLDGTVFKITRPASWEIANNVILDCGARDRTSVSVFFLEGEKDSLGTYRIYDNYINNTRPYLYPMVGNQQTERIRVSCFYITAMRFPTDFQMTNNTVVLNQYFDADNVGNGIWGGLGTSSADPVLVDSTDYGVFKEAGPLVFGGAIYRNQQNVEGTTWTAEGILNIPSVDPKKIISTGNMRSVADDGVLTVNEFKSFAISLETLRAQNVITVYLLDMTVAGYPIAFRSNLPFNVLIQTLDSSLENGALLPEFMPELFPLRCVSAMNGQNTALLLASGNVTEIPTNGPGMQGIMADIIQCALNKDTVREGMHECAICNDGCPALPPDSCQVDAKNSSFVPGNPYYGTWLFKTLNAALYNCTDPGRRITVFEQGHPWNEVWILDRPNWTIRTTDGATIKPKVPITFRANNITLDGFSFLDNTAGFLPTITSSSTINHTAPINITIKNCYFRGSGSRGPAISGEFYSIAIANTTFFNYNTATLVNISSKCGILYYDNNTVQDSFGYGLYAKNFIAATIRENFFLDCGGQTSPACVYLSMCKDNMTTLIFEGNDHFRDGYDEGSYPGGRTTAYWIDNIPLFRLKNITFDMTDNQADGLDIGIRVTNTDDLTVTSLTHDTKATVIYLYINERNSGAAGLWHFLVWGDPMNDIFIQNDPIGFDRYFCDITCISSAGFISGVIAIGIISVVLVFWFMYTLLCRVGNPIDLRVYTGRFCCRYF